MKTNHLPIWSISLLLAGSLLSSCEKDLEQTTPTQPTSSVRTDTGSHRALKAFPGQTGIIKQGTFRGQPITYEEINGVAVWQGDIILTEEDLAPVNTNEPSNPNARALGVGSSNKEYRWLNHTIPYEIGPGLNNATILAAMDEWQNRTTIRFVPRTNQTDYVRFVLSSGNGASIGRSSGMNVIQLAANQAAGIIIHEIGHKIGLFHEHTRSDRDLHVTYHKENVEPGQEFNFGIVDGFDHGKFDFNSIMMYGSFDFGKKNSLGQTLPTLTRIDGSTFEANTAGARVSTGDRQTVNSMYSNIYIVQNGTLYGVSAVGGEHYAALGNGWKGATKGIAEHDRYIWAIQGGKLWRTDRFSGQYQAVGNEDWSGPVVGMTGAEPGGFFYAQQGTRLWKIGSNGKRARLGGVNALENWSGTQAIYNLNGALYVIWKNTLYKINLTTGLVDKQYGGNWHDVNGIAAVSNSSTDLYCVLGEELWKVNTVTGQIDFVRGGWKNTTGMTGVDNRLYIVSDGVLHKITKGGNTLNTTNGYSGVTSIGAVRDAGLF